MCLCDLNLNCELDYFQGCLPLVLENYALVRLFLCLPIFALMFITCFYTCLAAVRFLYMFLYMSCCCKVPLALYGFSIRVLADFCINVPDMCLMHDGCGLFFTTGFTQGGINISVLASIIF